jgi:hypothetical protein
MTLLYSFVDPYGVVRIRQNCEYFTYFLVKKGRSGSDLAKKSRIRIHNTDLILLYICFCVAVVAVRLSCRCRALTCWLVAALISLSTDDILNWSLLLNSTCLFLLYYNAVRRIRVKKSRTFTWVPISLCHHWAKMYCTGGAACHHLQQRARHGLLHRGGHCTQRDHRDLRQVLFPKKNWQFEQYGRQYERAR